MNVKELKEQLANLPDDMEVIMQSDSEGNSYSPLYCADPDAVYIPDTTYSGSVYPTTWSADDAGKEDDDWEAMLKRPRCLVLAPTN